MCVLQIGQSTNRRNCRWTRRLGSGSLIGPPVTDSRVVVGTISPGLNLVMGWPPVKKWVVRSREELVAVASAQTYRHEIAGELAGVRPPKFGPGRCQYCCGRVCSEMGP